MSVESESVVISPFILQTGHVCLLFFILVSLARVLSSLLVLSKNQLLVSLIYSFFFLLNQPFWWEGKCTHSLLFCLGNRALSVSSNDNIGSYASRDNSNQISRSGQKPMAKISQGVGVLCWKVKGDVYVCFCFIKALFFFFFCQRISWLKPFRSWPVKGTLP